MGQISFVFDTEKDHAEIEMFEKTVDMGIAMCDIHDKLRDVIKKENVTLSSSLKRLLEEICEKTADFI